MGKTCIDSSGGGFYLIVLESLYIGGWWVGAYLSQIDFSPFFLLFLRVTSFFPSPNLFTALIQSWR